MPQALVEYARYDDFCASTSVAAIGASAGDAVAHVSAGRTLRMPVPVDLAGLMGAETPATTKASHRPESWWTAPTVVPPLYVAGLHDAVCFGGRVRDIRGRFHDTGPLLIAHERFLVDDSYHVRNGRRSLPADLVTPAGEGFILRHDLRSVKRHRGAAILLGSVYGHFGHFLLEGLSRTWALAQLDPDLPVVVFEHEPLHPWQLTILSALGVTEDRVIQLAEPRRFDRLLVPARAYDLHQGAAPELADAWAAIGARFRRPTASPRLYLSRSRFRNRRVMRNEQDVERLFERHGFDVVHPERLPIAEQIALARAATHLAGSVGSGTYLGMFQRRRRDKLIVSPRGFTFRDDQIVSRLRRGRLCYFLTDDEDAEQPARDRDYGVPLERLDAAVARWLEGDSAATAVD